MPFYTPISSFGRPSLAKISPATATSSSTASSELSSPTVATDPTGSDSESGIDPAGSTATVKAGVGSDGGQPIQHRLDVFADRESVSLVCKAVLHTVFFHRYFAPVRPRTHRLLEIALPATDNSDIQALIDKKVADLVRQLDDAAKDNEFATPDTGELVLMFFERRRRDTYFFPADVDVCWERWTINLTIGTPRTADERASMYVAMKSSVLRTVEQILANVARGSSSIPPAGPTPFPYDILVNPQQQQEEKLSGVASLWGFRPNRLGFGRRADVVAS